MKLVIFDFDDTLAAVVPFQGVSTFPPIAHHVEAIKRHLADPESSVHIITGRTRHDRQAILRWLQNEQVYLPEDHLHTEGDHLKKVHALLDDIGLHNVQALVTYDDDPIVLWLYKRIASQHGLPIESRGVRPKYMRSYQADPGDEPEWLPPTKKQEMTGTGGVGSIEVPILQRPVEPVSYTPTPGPRARSKQEQRMSASAKNLIEGVMARGAQAVVAEVVRDLTERDVGSVEQLKARYGQLWTTDQMQQDFEPQGFGAPYIVVIRKKDRVKGTLEFGRADDGVRYYYDFSPAGVH